MWKWRSFWIKDPTNLRPVFFKMIHKLVWNAIWDHGTSRAGPENASGRLCLSLKWEVGWCQLLPRSQRAIPQNFSADKTTFPAARNSFWTFPTFGDLDGMRNFVVRQRAASDCNFDQQFQFRANIYWFALNYTVPHFSVPESFDTLHNIEFHFSRLLQQGFPRFEATFIQLDYLWKVILIQNSICFRGEVDQQREIWRILKDLRRLQRG